MLQFGFIYPYLAPRIPLLCIFSLTYLNLSLFTYIWLYLGLITLIWSYLSLIALIISYVSYSRLLCILILRLHLCIQFESNRTITYGDTAFWRFGGYKSIVNVWSLGVNLVIDIFYVASDTLHWILKIWGLQKCRQRLQVGY